MAAKDGLPMVERFRLSVAALWRCGYCGELFATDRQLPSLIIGDNYQCECCRQLDLLEVERGNDSRNA